MLIATPDYQLFTYALVAIIVALILDWRRPLVPIACALFFLVLYARNGGVAAVMISFLVGMVDSLLHIFFHEVV